MRFRSKIHHVIRIVLPENVHERFLFANITLHKPVSRIRFYALQSFPTARISQLIDIDHASIIALLEQMQNIM